MTAIIDYGVGNLHSLISAIGELGAKCVVTANEQELQKADRIILPGVGAFGDAINKLREQGLENTVKELASSNKPFLGICLGMQLLYDSSTEHGEHIGVGLVQGSVTRFEQKKVFPGKIPHMGWNALEITTASPILKYTSNGDYVYYVHSYFAPPSQYSIAISTYGQQKITGIVQKDNIFGTQFHPEKSGKVGLAILKAFLEV